MPGQSVSRYVDEARIAPVSNSSTTTSFNQTVDDINLPIFHGAEEWRILPKVSDFLAKDFNVAFLGASR